MSFADDVKRFELKATRNIDLASRQIALELFSKVVKRTPVGNPTLWKSNELALLQRETYQVYRESIGKKRVSDKALQTKHGFKVKAPKGYVGGRARGNWQCSVGPQPVALESDVVDAEGNKTIDQIIASMSSWSPTKNDGVPIWIGNALPYIIRLEYDAWSSQARAGMVRISISESRVKTQTGQI